MSAVAALLVLAFADEARVQATSAAAQQAPAIDGRLDEPAWATARRHPLAYQKLPHYGEPPAQPTEFQLLHTPNSLVIGIRCHRADDVPIVARRTRRDRPVESDRVLVDIDSRGLGHDAFHFEVTAGGSLVDGIRYNDTKIDTQWDSVWTAAVDVREDGWTVEMEIPLSALRRPAGATHPIGLQVRRYTNALGATDEWARTPRDGSREVSRYGHLDGVELQRTVSLGLLPYLALGAQLERGATHPVALVHRYGADLKLRIGPDLTIDATALPDFGNVEADTAVVNLTTLEVRFPEKRPFFLEGVDVLQTPLELFYSRRIGSLGGTTAGTTTQANRPAPVLGAMKLLARAGTRWSLAGLMAVTQAQDLVVRDGAAGIVAPQRLLPTLVYGLGRARMGVRNGGFVAATFASRSGLDGALLGPWASCPDGLAPRRRRCLADVQVFSADARLRDRSGLWVTTMQLVGTHRTGGTPETGLDGNTLRAGDLGGAGYAAVEKTGGTVIGDATYQWSGRDADWNATGFLPQPHRHTARVDLGFQDLVPHGPLLEERWQIEVFDRFTLDGLPNGSGYQLNHRARWRSMWNHFVELHWRPSYLDIRETRDGRAFQRAGLLGLELEATSDTRRKLIADADVDVQVRSTGPRIDGRLDVDVNPSEALQLRLGLTATIDHGEPRWIGTDAVAGIHQFARMDANAVGVLARLNVTLARRLELQLYGQALGIETGWRDPTWAPAGERRTLYRELRRADGPAPPGEREALLIANLFLRWEYRPGSNLWLVLTRNPVGTVFDDASGRVISGGRCCCQRHGSRW
ncbi:MAG: DUF5916 domain-containing protein [Nannocystaceae bacterium]